MIWMELLLIALWIIDNFLHYINKKITNNITGDKMKKMFILMSGMAIGYMLSGYMSNCNCKKIDLNKIFKKK